MKRVNSNIGGANVREVFDRRLPTALEPECKRSQEEGSKGKGLNQQTMNESLADFNHGVEISK